MLDETATPTLTPTETATPTETFTPSPTPTETPNFYVEVTTEAGAPARIAREVSVADYTVILLLFAILVSMWAMYVVSRITGKGGQ